MDSARGSPLRTEKKNNNLRFIMIIIIIKSIKSFGTKHNNEIKLSEKTRIIVFLFHVKILKTIKKNVTESGMKLV